MNTLNLARLFSAILTPYLTYLLLNFQTVVGNLESEGNWSIDKRSSPNVANEVPRLPVWNGAPFDTSDQRHVDFTNLFEMMGEPRGSRGRELSELISRPKPRCNRRIRVLNGVTRIRERGSLARFQCSHGFTLIGPTTIVCLRDRWSEPPPICVRNGCRPLRTPKNGAVRQSIGGAVAAFFCSGNGKLIGNPVVFCDGIKWNGTEPMCHIEPTTAIPVVSTTEEVQLEIWPISEIPSDVNDVSTVNDFNWDLNVQLSTENPIPMSAKILTTFTPISAPQNTPRVIDTIAYISANETTSNPEANLEPSSSTPLISEDLVESVVSSTESSTEGQIITTTRSSTIHLSSTTTTEVTTPALKNVGLSSQTVLPLNATREKLMTTSASPIIANIPITTQAAVATLRPPRRFKITTKRPRRPFIPAKRPRYPKRPKVPTRRPQRPPPTTTTTTSRTSTYKIYSPSDDHTFSDYPIAIDKEFLGHEQVEPIRPILPDKLNNQDDQFSEKNGTTRHVEHASMIGGIVLFVIGLSTFSAGVILYCWRKNKGIARARPYDMDGRTLSAHDDANDDFMFLDQRDSGL